MLSAVLIVVSLLASPIGAAPIKVEIRPTESGFALYRGDKPYVIRGAGADNVDDLESLARAGANSTRTWSADAELLDRAAELGLTVALCLNVERERHGFDYNDREAVARQLEAMRQKVLQFRDHPALLVWIIGNELNHDYRNRRVYDAVNDISKMIHELDPHHPTTTATAGMDRRLARVLKNRAPISTSSAFNSTDPRFSSQRSFETHASNAPHDHRVGNDGSLGGSAHPLGRPD